MVESQQAAGRPGGRLPIVNRVLSIYSGSAGKKAAVLRLTIAGLICIVLGWVAGRGLDWREVIDSLAGLPPQAIALALVVFLLSNLTRAYRWRVLFVEERISVRRLFLIENMGLGINNFLPVRVASEATQFALLTLRDNISRGTALATLGMTRVVDIWSSTLLLSVGLFVVPGAGQLARYTVGALVISTLLLALVHFLAWGGRGLRFLERFPMLRTFSAALWELERNKLRMALSMFASLAHWGILGLSAWIVAQGMGIEISLAEAVLLTLATIFVSTSIPTVPGAIGVFEASIVYILGFFDVEKSLAFPYALVIHVLFFLPPTVMAAVLLPREGLGSLGQLRARSQALLRAPSAEPGPGK